jgi:hypothetical protein
MSSVGVVLEKIRERRVREGYREPQERERMPPDLVEPCARYPTAALLSFLAIIGGVLATIVLVVSLLVAASAKPRPAAPTKAAPAGNRAKYQRELERKARRAATTPGAAESAGVATAIAPAQTQFGGQTADTPCGPPVTE